MRKTILTISIIALAVASCSHPGDDIMPEEIAFVVKECRVPASGGTVEVKVFSNMDCRISPLGDPAPWVSLSTDRFSGDAKIGVSCEANGSFRRKASFRLTSPGTAYCDTLTVLQEGGIDVSLAFGNVSQMIYNGQGETLVPLNCNVDFSDVGVEVGYSSSESGQWIQSWSYSDGNLVLQTEDNASDVLRNARIALSFTDDWDSKYSTFVSLTQIASGNQYGTGLTMSEVKAWTGESFDGDYWFEGIVTSNTASGNAGDNVQLTATSIDYTPSSCTVYIQNEDGTSGLALVTASPEDNIFEQWSRVKVYLKGCTFEKLSDPERVTLRGVKVENLLESNVIGRDNVTIRRIAMADLSEGDIYTYLTLTDAEFAVRKGTLTPISENFTPVKGRNWITKFPLLVLGLDGKSIYTLTNINCTYRRDGQRLPYGRGDLSGVIVHERYPRFSYEDAGEISDYGDIGRYQIRTQSRSDIAMLDNATDVLVEYNYVVKSGEDRYIAPSNESLSSGLIHSYPKYTSGQNTSVWFSQDFPYLGPMGSDAAGLKTGNKSGCGLFDKNGREILGPGVQSNNVNSTGLGNVSQNSDPFLAWASNYWVNGSGFYAYQMYFSTKDITSGTLTLQLSMMGNATNGYSAPKFWHVQYYVGAAAPADTSADWQKVSESDFSLPDFCYISSPKEHSTPGYKGMNFVLPEALLNKDKVWIAIRPRNGAASSASGYSDGTIGASTGGSTAAVVMNYIAVRVN